MVTLLLVIVMYPSELTSSLFSPLGPRLVCGLLDTALVARLYDSSSLNILQIKAQLLS